MMELCDFGSHHQNSRAQGRLAERALNTAEHLASIVTFGSLGRDLRVRRAAGATGGTRRTPLMPVRQTLSLRRH